MYRQTLPGHGLSIEQGTADVPADGYYYVIHDGMHKGRYRTLTQATKRYLEIKGTLAIAPLPSPTVSAEDVQRRDLELRSNKALFWGEEDFARVDRKTRGRPKH